MFEANASRLVLVVEDDEGTREELCLALRDRGYGVASAADGHDALSLMASRRPTLIILDLEMPRMAGPAVLDVMRADPNLATIPVLVITGSSVRPPFNLPVFHKPLGVDGLLRAVDILA